MTIPLREDFDATQARTQASRCDNGNQARRFLSIAAIYDGMNRATAARIGGMDRQTLRDWVHRFNEAGPKGLLDLKAPGASPKLTASQLEELAAVVETGPDPGVRWHRALAADGSEALDRGTIRRCLQRPLGVALAEAAGLLAHQRPASPPGTR